MSGLSDANLSKTELCERIRVYVPDFVHLEAPVGEDLDKRDYIVSNKKLSGTGFAPAYSLDSGIVELIKGYPMLRNCDFYQCLTPVDASNCTASGFGWPVIAVWLGRL